jgi:uncharacterized Zn finger protein
MGYWDYYEYYTPKPPKKVKNGIKLEGKKIGATWWSRRWISTLDSFGWSNRLERGRRYARSGQVTNIKIAPGVVTAGVQGTRPKPYQVIIKIKPTDPQWKTIIQEMSTQALYAAKLVSGDMPSDIENVFSAVHASLFPSSKKDLKTDCSCPDVANPCKHIAAVYYVLGEEFDRNPFMIFHLRGRSKQQFLDELRNVRGEMVSCQEKPEKKQKERCIKRQDSPKASQRQETAEHIDLERCIDRFWRVGEKFSSFSVSIQPPVVPIALIRRLGPPTFWRGCSLDFYTEIERIYKKIQEDAMQVAYETDVERSTKKER